MKFPVNSLLAGNLAFSETSSQLTPPSSGESSRTWTSAISPVLWSWRHAPLPRPQSRLPRRSHRVAIATNVRRGLGEQFGEPVPPRLGRNIIIESTFEVGRRFRCAMRVDCGELDPAAVIRRNPANGIRACPRASTKRSLRTGAQAATRSIRRSTFSAAKLSDGACEGNRTCKIPSSGSLPVLSSHPQ